MQTSPTLRNEVFNWAPPIVWFGNIRKSEIATLGINPSNKEFENDDLDNLDERASRFPTLETFRLDSWEEARNEDLQEVISSYNNYFRNNPYKRWFNVLEYLFRYSDYSYYFPSENLIHLDVVPVATKHKWSQLNKQVKNEFIENYGGILGQVVKSSKLKCIILNGRSVVSFMQELTNSELVEEYKPEWDLKRGKDGKVRGYSYQGKITRIGDVALPQPIKLLGYNHNLQSSFGVSKIVLDSVGNWVNKEIHKIYE